MTMLRERPLVSAPTFREREREERERERRERENKEGTMIARE